MRTSGRWRNTATFLAALAFLFTCARAAAQATVTITSNRSPAVTMEPCPVCDVAPLAITISRTGPTDEALNVGLTSSGVAIAGVDYMALPDPVTIPKGHSSVIFHLSALDDHLAEGPEVAEISITPVNAAYEIGTPGTLQAVIADDERDAPSERLDITVPQNGATFASGTASIKLEAIAVSTSREIDIPVEFYANGTLIGKSSPLTFGRPPIPWLPRTHEFEWLSPADGNYTLTARVPAKPGAWLDSPPITITVGKGDDTPTVSIVATFRVAEEDSAPTLRPMVFRGEFTISRTGPTTAEQPVYLHVSGTAAPGKDYTALPFLVSIPAGAASTKVQVAAIPDKIAEPLETVVVEISNCPPDNLPIRPPCYLFSIDPSHSRDTVFIRDDGITRATIEITAPQNGAHFTTGEPVTIDATAIDISGVITSVDFYAGNQKIGSSQIHFIVEPPPGSPIHHTFTWAGAPAGTHTLTVKGTPLGALPVVSPPVTITVGSNQPPQGRITSPAPGAQIPFGAPLEITASATDPDGYVDYAEFFADGHKLGDVHLNFLVPPPPGETQVFSFTWNDVSPGSHVLSVRFRDDDLATALTAPVNITVTTDDGLPVITVVPADPFAVEPAAGNPATNKAIFRLRRSGSAAAALSVNFTLSGSATNGTDYAQLPIAATFPTGDATVPVVVDPLADNLAEGRETVILTVEPQFDDGPTRYHVGHHRRAAAIIADASWHVPQPGVQHCSPVANGLFHLCFPATLSPAFRIEASQDFLHWETVQEAVAVDGEIHFIDPDAPNLPKRFYRMADDPAAAGP
ncbi:MAG TPA: Ig-like domain-containing protein [Verrucomicrobiales bacterium]|nr:Ig-like domain-containing protein [Verrucomicrobiales bacterium]